MRKQTVYTNDQRSASGSAHSKSFSELYSVAETDALPKTQNVSTLNAASAKDFSAIYQTHYPFCFFYARKFVSPEDASDIVAGVFIKLWQLANPHFASMNNVKMFLRVCVKNACLSHIEKEKTRAKHHAAGESMSVQDPGPFSFSQTGIHAEKLEKIYHAIEKLPVKCRRIFTMAYIDGLEIPEIARELGLALNTVRSQKQTAITKIRMSLLMVAWIVMAQIF